MLGGAARITHRLLRELATRERFACRWIGGLAETDLLTDFSQWEALGINRVSVDPNGLEFDLSYPCFASRNVPEKLQHTIQRHDSSIVWTQLEYSEKIAAHASRMGMRAFIYLVDAEYDANILSSLDDPNIRFVCLSKFLAHDLHQRTGIQADVLYPIVDPPLTHQPKSFRESAAGEVLMINPFPQKGIETFLEIARQTPEIRYRLLESWTLGTQMMQWLQQNLQQLPNVAFSRRVANMSQVYRQASLLLVPSIWKEGFGMVAIEAQCHGIPVIASERGGLPESVGPGGILIRDFLDPGKWAEEIRSLLRSPDHYQHLSEATRDSVYRSDFQAENVVGQFESIIETTPKRPVDSITLPPPGAKNEGRFHFIQIGAHIGATENDPLFSFVRPGHRGILVEPVPEFFDQLVQNYAACADEFTFVNKAISTYDGTIKLYVPSKQNDFSKLPYWASQLASIAPTHATQHIEQLRVNAVDVPCVTLNKLIIDQGVEMLDVLSIDTEGHDVTILQSLDLDLLRPRQILFENKHSDGTNCRAENYQNLIQRFSESGYRVAREDDVNTLLVLRDEP